MARAAGVRSLLAIGEQQAQGIAQGGSAKSGVIRVGGVAFPEPSHGFRRGFVRALGRALDALAVLEELAVPGVAAFEESHVLALARRGIFRDTGTLQHVGFG